MYRFVTVLLVTLSFGLTIAQIEFRPVLFLGVFHRVSESANVTNSVPSTSLQNASRIENDVASPAPPKNPHRIVGGRPIDISEVPWQASLTRDGRFVCGASVISRFWILTAAHCLDGYSEGSYEVRAGSSHYNTGGQVRRVGLMLVHRKFSPRHLNYDIGLLRLRRRLTFSKNLRPVILAKPKTKIPEDLFISGWGATVQSVYRPSPQLLGVDLTLVDRKTCSSLYSASRLTVTSQMICAGNLSTGGRDSCQGDSGGPLVSGGIQFGIVSFGIGCGHAYYPSVNAYVGALYPWIMSTTRNARALPNNAEERDWRVVYQVREA